MGSSPKTNGVEKPDAKPIRRAKKRVNPASQVVDGDIESLAARSHSSHGLEAQVDGVHSPNDVTSQLDLDEEPTHLPPTPPISFGNVPDDTFRQAIWVAQTVERFSEGEEKRDPKEPESRRNGLKRKTRSQYMNAQTGPQASKRRNTKVLETIEKEEGEQSRFNIEWRATKKADKSYGDADSDGKTNFVQEGNAKYLEDWEKKQCKTKDGEVEERLDFPSFTLSDNLSRTLCAARADDNVSNETSERNACGSDAKVMGAVYSILKAYRDPGTADADESGPTPGLDTSGSTAITESSALISRAGSYTGDTETKLNKGKQRALTPAVSSDKSKRTNEVITALNTATAILTELAQRDFNAYWGNQTKYVTPYANPVADLPQTNHTSTLQTTESTLIGGRECQATGNVNQGGHEINKETHDSNNEGFEDILENQKDSPKAIDQGLRTDNAKLEANGEIDLTDIDADVDVDSAKGLATENTNPNGTKGPENENITFDSSQDPAEQIEKVYTIENIDRMLATVKAVLDADSDSDSVNGSGVSSQHTEPALSPDPHLPCLQPFDQDDKAIQAIVDRIINDVMAKNDHWRNLPPGSSQAAFYQSDDGQRLAAELKLCMTVAAPKINTILPKEQSYATSNFYAHLSSRAYIRNIGGINPTHTSAYGYPAQMNYNMLGVPAAFQPAPPPPQPEPFVPRGNVMAPPPGGGNFEENRKVREFGYPPLPGSRPGQMRKR